MASITPLQSGDTSSPPSGSIEQAPAQAIAVFSPISRYWALQPGSTRNGTSWRTSVQLGRAAIYWSGITDIRDFDLSSNRTFEIELASIADKTKSQLSPAFAGSQLWQFTREMQIGDCIAVTSGESDILGWGVVTGDYDYDDEPNGFVHFRLVEWLVVPESPLADLSPQLAAHLPKTQLLIEITEHDFTEIKSKLPIDATSVVSLSSAESRSGPSIQVQSHDRIQRLIESIYPDPAIRRACLAEMAQSIQDANDLAPGSWSITIRRADPRPKLNVGRLQVMRLVPDALEVWVDPEADPGAWAELNQDTTLSTLWGGNSPRSFDRARGIAIPVDRLADVMPMVRPLHTALLSESISLMRTSPWGRIHADAVVEYLRQELGEDLPDPPYRVDQPQTLTKVEAGPIVPEQAPTARRFWKMSAGHRGQEWPTFLDGHFVAALGWMSAPDLRTLDTTSQVAFRESLADVLADAKHHYSIPVATRQLWAFLQEMRPGDAICIYGTRTVRGWGVITGDYTFDASTTPNIHLRSVDWTSNQPRPAAMLPDDLGKKLQQGINIIELTADEFATIVGGALPPAIAPNGDGELLPGQPPTLAEIADRIAGAGLRIDGRTLRRYHLALRTRGFVILSGLSGTGKTWLATSYASAAGGEYLVVPVAPNWNANEDLLGYHNPLTGLYHHTEFTRFLARASAAWHSAADREHPAVPYHVILDEMNLARVEYYFAAFLSQMEVRARHGSATLRLSPTESIELTPNLFVIGTVNIDETTHGFADKVYDRAQLLEIDADRAALAAHLGARPYANDLLAAWDILHRVAPFSYRVLDEIAAYVDAAAAHGVPWPEALDEQLVQKILPKLKGTDPKVGRALDDLLMLTVERFPLTHARTVPIRDGFVHTGIASYFG